MNRIKTLSLPLISALIGSAALPANAGVTFEVSSDKIYRQDKKGIKFIEGSFETNLADGNALVLAACTPRTTYLPPSGGEGCSIGTTAFLTNGSLRGITLTRPYFAVSTVIPAMVIAPRAADAVTLIAAPASKLRRPSGGFEDYSYSLYFNLHSTFTREYDITRYSQYKYYPASQRKKFESEIVPGVYHYSFPRLNPFELPGVPPAVIQTSIYPMAEGNATLNKRSSGFAYKKVNANKWTKGFVELSYHKPNKITWQGLDQANVAVNADRMYFSMKVMGNPKNPKSYTDSIDRYTLEYQAIYPDYQTSKAEEPRIWLANPFVGRFTVPPVFAGGTRSIVEVELDRSMQTGGVTYDFSNRRFQIPVVVVNRYSEFVETTFDGAKNSGILKDTDGDGHNNLTEWILDSSATDSSSIPESPFPMTHAREMRVNQETETEDRGIVREAYYGFTIDKKLETVPQVVYTLQRRKSGERTWRRFKTDDDWTVETVRLAPGYGSQKANSPERVEIRVESKWNTDGNLITENSSNKVQGPPPGTAFDDYRVKITLKKKKK